MIGGFRLVRQSERAMRAQFAKYTKLEVSGNPFITALRKNRHRRAHSGYRMPNQRRAYPALNVIGIRIWANKPGFFGGRGGAAFCATIDKSIERAARRQS